jgi:transposase-like protein
LKQKKKQNKTPKQLPDFSIEDILNAPKPKPIEASGCPHCGSVNYISKNVVKVFRGQRMVVHHCHGCGQDFYKEE